MENERPIRVLVAKPGLDGHDRGAKVIARVLRDAGMEVVYTGLRRTIAEIVSIAEQEDVDVLGLSLMAGGVIGYTRDLLEALQEAGLDTLVVVGGVIMTSEIPELNALGVEGVFPVGSSPNEYIRRASGGRVDV